MYQQSINLGDLIDLNKDLTRTAVFDQRRYTYRELNQMSMSYAAGLRSRGVETGTPVAIIMPNSVDFIAAYLGILRIGAVAVLINVKLPQTQIDYILEDSGAGIAITESNHADYMVGSNVEFEAVDKKDRAVMLYTSGTTSVPKGVILSHEHKWTITSRAAQDQTENRRVFVGAPFYHMNGLSNMEYSLATHSTLFLMPSFDAAGAIRLIGRHRITTINCVPSMMAMILADADTLEQYDISSVKRINTSSAPLSPALYDKIKQYIPGVSVNINYGTTEGGPGLFGPHPTRSTPPGSVGYPVKGIDYRIVDGILEVRSPAMMLGYNNIETNTLTEDGYYITNDLFRTDEHGFYYFISRADDMFVSGGNNIYPSQVESVLNTHDAVFDSAVVGVEDEIKGTKPYAFVVLKTETSEQELKDHVLAQLPPSHCPRSIWFVDQLPVTSVNKVDRKKLMEDAVALLSTL